MPTRSRTNPSPTRIRRVRLDDLARLSPWPAILTGAKPFAPRRRTAEEILREYGAEKWGRVLQHLKGAAAPDQAQLLRSQGIHADRPLVFAEKDELFSAPADYVFARYQDLVLGVLRRYRTASLVELGSGLGDKLLTFARELGAARAVGGEFTPSGIACGRVLARKWQIGADFRPFDFNDPRTLSFVPAGSLVYTAHAIEQVSVLDEGFIAALCRRRPRWVAHFEPCHEDQDPQSVLGLMRRRYAEVNDYNRNLVGLLRNFEAQGWLRIVEHHRDLFGVSPFNPTSVLVWTPIG